MPSLCVRCQKSFKSWFDYHEHIAKCNKVLPINTSGRTKLQIVINAEETYLKPYLIGDPWIGRQ